MTYSNIAIRLASGYLNAILTYPTRTSIEQLHGTNDLGLMHNHIYRRFNGEISSARHPLLYFKRESGTLSYTKTMNTVAYQLSLS